MAEALQSSLQQKELDLRKLTGQAYDGAATFAAFSGKIRRVYKRIQTSSAHAIYIHCSCHRLQLASIQATSVKEIGCVFSPPKNNTNRGIEGQPDCSCFSQAEDREA